MWGFWVWGYRPWRAGTFFVFFYEMVFFFDWWVLWLYVDALGLGLCRDGGGGCGNGVVEAGSSAFCLDDRYLGVGLVDAVAGGGCLGGAFAFSGA